MSIAVVFGLIAFAGVFLFFLGISQMRRAAGGTEDFQARLAAYGVTTAGAQALPQSSGMRDTLNRLFQPAADRMGRGDAKKGKPSVTEQLQRADLKLRPSEYFMIQLGSAVVVGLIGYWRWGLIFLGLAILGYLIPGFYVKYRVNQRLKKFNGQLGDTLTLLSNALKAGYSFAQAIDTVAKNAVAPIGDEFGRAVREMNLGGSPDDARLLPAHVLEHHRLDPDRGRRVHDLHRQPDHPPHRGDRGLAMSSTVLLAIICGAGVLLFFIGLARTPSSNTAVNVQQRLAAY